MTIRIVTGDCRVVLATLKDESVHCAVTSPPYWGLRDYSVDMQIGLEKNIGAYVSEIVSVFREVRRVLRRDGTLWLNLGDSYAGSGRGGNPTEETSGLEGGQASQRASMIRRVRGVSEVAGTARDAAVTNRFRHAYKASPAGLKQKDLIGMPWRVAFALQEDGWYLRQDIIWSKPNPMPESVTDRCTKAHEYLFLLSKSERYYYDAEAIKEPASYDPDDTKFPDGWDTGDGGHGSFHRNGREKGQRIRKTDSTNASHMPGAPPHSNIHRAGTPRKSIKRNKRSVWEIATAAFPDAHFATFPPALVEPCILAGTSEKGCCAKCGAPWVREVERVDKNWDGSKYGERAVAASGGAITGGTAKSTLGSGNGKLVGHHETIGWSRSCSCSEEIVPCTVLDPFAGAGTTGLVADRLQRDAILIELNPDYAAMAERRLHGDGGMMMNVQVENASTIVVGGAAP